MVKADTKVAESQEPINWDKEVTKAFLGLMRLITHLPKSEQQEVRRAYQIAKDAHKSMIRKSGEPYILHPIAVARIVAEDMKLNSTSIICALLHDTVEDTHIELDDIQHEFGNTCRNIIDGLTKISRHDGKLDDAENSLQAENFRKVLLTISDDIRVVLIKLADRLHNMRTLESMKEEKRLKIASETLFLYAPLAHRLGLYSIKTELEDLSFRYTQPQMFAEISTKLDATKEEADAYIERFKRTIRSQLSKTGLNYKIKSRYKSIYSIYRKIVEKGVPFEEIFDLYAIRIIIEDRPSYEIDDCWQAYSTISKLYLSHPNRLRDWLRVPKENGYQSLHMTVMGPEGKWVEIQIRTVQMDEMAENGVSAHWKYKKGSSYDDQISLWIEQVREILANPNVSAIEAIREFRANLRPSNLYVFTPKGELVHLPIDATVLDFAYYVHSKIGNISIGAKVNSQVVPLDYQLKQGDQIEVLTSKKAKPQEDWLKIAKTPRATSYIKAALRDQRKEHIAKGKELFQWWTTKYSIGTERTVKELLAYLRIPTKDDFFYALAMHKIETKKLLTFVQLKQSGQPIPSEKDKVEATPVDEDQLVLGKNIEIDNRIVATCCQPIPGDDVLAFQEPNRIIIHRTSCPDAIALMAQFGSQIIKARWAANESSISFLCALKVVGLDKQGMLIDLLRVISNQMKLNIRKVTIASKDGLFEGLFHIYVADKDQLNRLMKRLTDMPEVYTATRTDSHFQPFEGES